MEDVEDESEEEGGDSDDELEDESHGLRRAENIEAVFLNHQMSFLNQKVIRLPCTAHKVSLYQHICCCSL